MYLDYEDTGGSIRTVPAPAEHYLELICDQMPEVSRTIRKYGSSSIGDYLDGLIPSRTAPFQSREDLAKTVYNYAVPLLGESVASSASEELLACPLVMTANHHGVDYFSQSVQGSLLFSMLSKNGTGMGKTTLVFSCGAVPLDNITYPLGFLLYDTDVQALETTPVKLPVFSNRSRRILVSVAGPFNKTMLQRAESRLRSMVKQEKISASMSGPVPEILKRDYGSNEVLNLDSYSQQSVILNSRIWNRLFSVRQPSSQLVYLELEKIVTDLLQKDLLDDNSLVERILFDDRLQQAVISELDGAKACWNLDLLFQRVETDALPKAKRGNVNGCGTIFFWGLTTRGRRIPLCLGGAGTSKKTLRGVDDRGNHYELPFTPDCVVQALKEDRLLPSLFTCFTVLSFARGVACAGGYYQAEYLPNIQRGIVSALEGTKGYESIADIVKKVDTGIYLSGMQAVMKGTEANMLIPAGPVEIIAAGGLTNDDLERIRSLTVKDAHLASLFETIPDVAPWLTKTDGWKNHLAADCWRLLRKAVVVK